MDKYFNLYIVRRIVSNKKLGLYLSVFLIISYAPISILGFIGIPLDMLLVAFVMGVASTLIKFLVTWFIYLFPVYLFITLFLNQRKGWAYTLGVLMVIAYSPLLLNIDEATKLIVRSLLPLFFLVVFCFFLNIAMRDWALEDREELLMREEKLSGDISNRLRNR